MEGLRLTDKQLGRIGLKRFKPDEEVNISLKTFDAARQRGQRRQRARDCA